MRPTLPTIGTITSLAMALSPSSYLTAAGNNSQAFIPISSKQVEYNFASHIMFTNEVYEQKDSCSTYYSRFGSYETCTDLNIYIKLRIKPIPTTNIQGKSVGITYKMLKDEVEKSVHGSYLETLADGTELWQVPVKLRGDDVRTRDFLFQFWYQTGNGNVIINNNKGQYYQNGTFDLAYVKMYNAPYLLGGRFKLDFQLVTEKISFEKNVKLFYTTDDWKTKKTISNIWEENDHNTDSKIEWTEDFYGHSSWNISLDIEEEFDNIEFAILYSFKDEQTGRLTEVWENNNHQNYKFRRSEVIKD